MFIDFFCCSALNLNFTQLENLLLRSKDDITDIMLADFGESRFLNLQDEMMKTTVGTPSYVAPEVLESKQGYGIEVGHVGGWCHGLRNALWILALSS